MPKRHRPGMNRNSCAFDMFRCGGAGENNAVILKERISNEESLASKQHAYIYLLWQRVSFY